ncbi:MAG: helix-turn-helix domain-containing protein [Spirochaetes bacterium]|nr:helix-turn-helix domain-containing protein [Spirochaetota bacterium]
MESVGEKLRKAREAKNVSLDQVSRETNIAKRYLQALEEEDVSLFPGDTYAIGFLRNYAEYLGLNPAELITLYKNMRLQEQPVPIEVLLEKKRSFHPFLVAGIGAIILLAVGLFLFLRPMEAKKEKAEVVSRAATKIQYKGLPIEQSFIEGDEIVFSEEIGSVRVAKVSSTVELVGNFGRLVMKQGQESLLDLPGAKQLVKVTCNTLQREGKTSKAVLKFEMVQRTGGAVATEGGRAGTEGSGSAVPVGSVGEGSRLQRPRLVLESPSKAPFTLEIEFTGYCFFRYRVDNSEREERYFRKGETFKIDIQKEIVLGFSNAGALRGRIQGKEIEFGRPGQVGVGILKWVENPGGGSFRLEFVPVY